MYKQVEVDGFDQDGWRLFLASLGRSIHQLGSGHFWMLYDRRHFKASGPLLTFGGRVKTKVIESCKLSPL